jgi:diaminohydroxyphosphoribosylaminopyrimidine deaminase/5-amino-6-(5-phosphoribosylamino)uracil reductase
MAELSPTAWACGSEGQSAWFPIVMIEGGGDVLGQAFDQRLVNEIQFYFAPLILGGPVVAVAGRGVGSNEARLRLTEVAWEQIGPDLCLSAQLAPPSP